MRQLGRIAKCMLAGMTGIIMVLPMPSSGADSGRHSSPLDSRTVPHPEWAQISGQIERTSTAGPNNGDASVRAIIRLSEGGHVAVDFGAAAVSSFRPKMDDFIHVRGEAIEKEGQLIVIAREVYAEGQVFRIPQRDETALEPTGQPGRASGESSPPLSPAAPAPRER